MRRGSGGAKKNHWIKLYEIIWNLLRIAAGIMLCIPASCMGLALGYAMYVHKPEPIMLSGARVCGAVSGVAYEFSDAYVPFWPEYEGDHPWGAGSYKTKKECDANLLSLSLAVNWPQLTPGNYFSEQFTGLLITLEPWTSGEQGLRETLDLFLEEVSPKQGDKKTFDSLLGLYRVEGIDSLFPEAPREIFWSELNGYIREVGRCTWSQYRAGYHRCHFRYLLGDKRSIVKIDFSWSDLGQWGDIARRSNEFLMANKK